MSVGTSDHLPGGRPHRLIRASAGSGKTYQLTRHYLDLLRRGAAVDTILATTFTRKAAGEILGRVVRTLAEAADGEHDPMGLGPDRAREMLGQLCGQLHRVAISTLDSFFQRLGSCFRLELDLPLQPTLMEEGSPAAERLRAEAIEATLADAAATDETFVALLALLRRLHHDRASRSVTRAIDQIVVSHAAVYREAPDRDAWTRLRVEGLLDDRQLNEAIESWRQMKPQLPTTKTGKPRSHWEKSWIKIGQQAVAGDWENIANSGILQYLLEDKEIYAGAEISRAWIDAATPFLSHMKGTLVQQIAQQTEATYELMRRFAERYDRLRRQRGVMLYSDLTHRLAAGALPMGDGGDVLTEVYFRLDRAVTHLLLDEFQDTGLDQWAVLSPFAEEVAATGDGTRSLFVVGDTKQAIYGWRGGCVELFDSVADLVPPEGRDTLAKSWRSSPVVLDAVNTVFEDISGCPALLNDPDDAAAAAAWGQGFVAHESAKPGLPGYVSFEVSGAGEEEVVGRDTRDDDADGGEAEGLSGELPGAASAHERAVARRIADLHAAMPGRSLGVLLSTNPAVNRLLYELRRIGLPASGEGGNPIADHPAVATLLSGLQLADHPGDTASAFHVLNSPLGGVLGMAALGDASRVARRVRAALVNGGTAATVAGWVRRLAGACDAAGLEKLTRLIDLAERYDAEPTDPLRPARFVDYVEGTRVEDPSNAAVRVMTIHKSKGLEFDAVVLPQLDRRLRNVFDVLTDRPDPTGAVEAVYRYAGSAARAASPALAEAYAQRRRQQRREDLSALYVAMTRARQGLYLIAQPAPANARGSSGGGSGSGALTFAGVLRDTLGDPAAGLAWGDPGWAGSDTPDAAKAVAPEPAADAGRPTSALAHDTPTRRMRPTVNPSALHGGGAVHAYDLLSLTTPEALRRGSAVHAALETIEYFDENQPIENDELAQALRHTAVRAALSRRFGEREELWRERGFVVADGERLVKGVFDRVAIERDTTGRPTAAHLIDFKSDTPPGISPGSSLENQTAPGDSAALAERVEAYRPQLDAYRRALASMLKLSPEKITAELLFTAPGVSVTV